MTPSDHAIVAVVLRHNGIPDAEHGDCINLSKYRGDLTSAARRNYRSIYASLTAEERMAAHESACN